MAMYAQSARFRQLKRLLTVLVALPIGGGAALVALGIVRFASAEGLWLIIAGGAIIIHNLIVWVFGQALLKVDANTARSAGTLYDLLEELQRHTARLDDIGKNVRLSDAARSLAHRQEEGNALRAAIRAEIGRNDWEAVWHLISDMEQRYGYKDEAERLRQQVRHEQAAFYHSEVARAVPLIEQMFDAYDWELAEQEIGRLLRAFPNEARFTQLSEELQRRRQARKEELVRTFTEAVQRDDIDIDTGMQVLQELDKYLTPQEAKELEESARKVVRGKLEQLGVRFRFAVTEERWRDALEVGVSITEEFPNSRVAQEVRERLNILRERAGLAADVEVTSAKPPKSGD